MKFSTSREKLLSLIDHAEGIIERRNTIPILSHFVFTAAEGELRVTASDLDTIVINRMQDLQIEAPGQIAIPATLFSGVLRKLPANSQVIVSASEGKVKIQAGRGRYQLPTLPADQLPMFERPKADPVSISTQAFNRALRMVRHSMSTEETRYYLNGVFLEIKDGELLAVSTDGHRLSVAKICDVDFDQPDAILPRKPVNHLVKILAEFEGDIRVITENNKIDFQIGDLVVASKLIDGTFPDYRRVIPSETPIEIVVCPRSLGQAIDRVSVVSHEKTKAIVFDAADASIKLEMNSPDMGTASEEVSAQISAPIRAGYNSRYLKEILDCYAECDTVRISLKGPSDPAIISPPGNGSDRAIIMPMRI